ncbi:serine-rich adhesin for platelets [Parasteatoda tepidariorum]|uniref:serine-rich adhesin for platelets n=1 Tax=Parasteatoda tepidariorum TaxID=114398 RepID=UPI00077FD1E8|nr:uncharacterized protein LOC107438276 [Parasteatoda tepidariorum]XP_042905629.1 uncharacterized protein LOC107438276 [Parasteatoda tepidariorum]
MSGDNQEERQARSLALEKAYVHDVYDQIASHFTDTRYRPWPRVKQFLLDLEPGSLVADVGCGNGKYLDINPEVMKIGVDRCEALTAAARAKNYEVMTSDNLHLPFRDETFDAVLSIAVIHHFATTDRRVAAIKEITRVLRIGGKVLITVWAMEQRHRKFDSQDVLVPWHEPVKSSSEDRGSSVERELTSTTTSDDDILVYHAYSHISDNEGRQAAANKKRQKFRNGPRKYRSAGSAEHCRANSSQSSSELSSPNETCYSFVRRAFQRLSNPAYDDVKHPPSSNKPYFYRSCRKPCVSESMDFGKSGKENGTKSPKNDAFRQDSLDSDYPDQPDDDDIPIEIRHLEGYDMCKKCGTPTSTNYEKLGSCEAHMCTSCLPVSEPDSGKKSRSLIDFLNMIPGFLRVKKCEKEPLSDLHKRISTASDPREYVIKARGGDVNGIVRSKSTVSMMSRLEELMSLSPTYGKEELETESNPNITAGPRVKAKPSMLQTFAASVLVDGIKNASDIPVVPCETKSSRRYNSPADALRKLRQDVSLEEDKVLSSKCNIKEINTALTEEKLQNSDFVVTSGRKSSVKISNGPCKVKKIKEPRNNDLVKPPTTEQSESTELKTENDSLESHLSSYYSMPELYKLIDDIPEETMFNSDKQRHISFYEQAQNILADTSSGPNDLASRVGNSTFGYQTQERTVVNIPQRGLVKRSLSVDTGDNSSSSHQVPRRFSASAAQGVLASALRTYTMPRSCSRGSSVKSDTSVDSEESIVSVIPRKGNSITSDTSVDSEESVISVIQRSTSEFETLGSQNEVRHNISRFGSRSAQASPVTVLSSQTSSAESSPPQSGKNDGRFPGSSGVIDQLMQQQQLNYPNEGNHVIRQDGMDHSIRTRRSLIRPISDPKIEDKLHSRHSEDSNGVHLIKKISSDSSKSSQGSLESDDGLKMISDKDLPTNKSITESKMKPPSEVDATNESDKKDEDEGELSRTPSPIGPICYITDPLITGIEPSDKPSEATDLSNESESRIRSIRFNSEVTDLEKTKPRVQKSPNEPIESVLKNSKKSKLSESEPSEDSEIIALDNNNSKQNPSEIANNSPTCSTSDLSCRDLKQNIADHAHLSKSRDSEVRRSLFKLKERLESLTSSQGSIQSFDLFKNVSHTFGSLRNIKEKLESEGSGEASKVSPTSKSLNDSRQSSLDESSQVTLSDESVISMEGTSSVSDETNDYRRTDDEEDNPDSSQVLTVKKVNESVGNALSEKPVNQLEVAKCDEKCVCPIPRPPKTPSFSDTELHAAKKGVRCGLRKRLKRSCVTIDEVECREFVSSEDTSPSSSVSLEWNDFDKVDAYSSGAAACCSGGHNCRGGEPSVSVTCDDVNVAEPETKFNIVMEKEMCVFFETPPSSSMGKSASSSSNATDFSTTSDRIRGVMQRERSDDRSSKESDSDNLSKLSDIEARSDSAFSEDFARRTDLASSSSSASLDVLDSLKSKLSNDCECDAVSSTKQTTSWVLDNIDEMPDDDQCHGEVSVQNKSLTPSSSSSWKSEMSDEQRKKSFLNCAADCRDMYRISFDEKGRKERRFSVPDAELERPHLGLIMPDIAPSPFELFPNFRRNAEEAEQPTDLIAAIGEAISDVRSAFWEVYPRQEPKIEDCSSDESVRISTFEKILTAVDPPKCRQKNKSNNCRSTEQKLQNNKSNDRPEENTKQENGSGKRCSGQKSCNGSACDLENKESNNPKSNLNCLGQAYVELPPETVTNSDDKENKTGEDQDTKCSIPNSNSSEKKIPEKLKILNRSSQSVCLDRLRQSSVEEDIQSTQSAPCSPRMKPRQKSVEEVLSSSKNELSRNSSLSQSTSQESLPENETGGLMAYHRYYHVFREGELDNLIETHVDNLHIISSYYDHANWCVVAEKVQVWTI